MSAAEVVAAIVTVTLAIGGGTGLWSWLASRHRPEVDRQTAEAATATAVGDLALAIAKRADGRVACLEGRVSSLEGRLGKWAMFGQDLHQRWPMHRQSETPPPLPE